MQFILLFLTLILLVNRSISTGTVLDLFRQQALTTHNRLRAMHCATPLKLNSTLNTIAQNYAEYLIANHKFTHSGAADLGENLWIASLRSLNAPVNGSDPAMDWYSEVSKYDYNSPESLSGVLHFTQLIWNDTTQLGIGCAVTSDGRIAKVVANYFPEGNVIGSFAKNVFPLCSNVGGD